MTTSEVSLRPATANDCEFAYRTTRDTMRGYVLATWGEWNEDEARQRSSRNIAAGFTQIIELDHAAIGIHVVARAPDSIRLVQLFILPEYQRRGIGSKLIERLLAEARMGFKVIEATPERYFMEHSP